MTVLTAPKRAARQDPVLPEPPAGEELYQYSDRGRLYVITLLVIGFASNLAAQVFLEVNAPFGWLLSPVTALYVVYHLANMRVSLPGQGFDFAAHSQRVAAWAPQQWPTVDIFLPICGEPLGLLENTWQAVAELIRAYPGHARAYVLDDGNDPGLEPVAARYGLTYECRPNPGEHKKAGNLRWAFSRTEGEHIVIFDADFAPSARFLAETLPFMDDPAVGIIQTPQYFRSHPADIWVARAAGTVQEIFYRLIQVARDRLGSALCVGTNAVYRRAALEPECGFTLIAHSEDSHTGLDTLHRGYATRYVPVVLAAGSCPSTLSSYVRQQYRWACGSVSLVFTDSMWRAPMRWRMRMPFISGFLWNLHLSAAAVIGPVVPVAVLIYDPVLLKPGNFVILVPAIMAELLAYPLWHRSRYGPSAWPIQIVTGWAQALAIWDYARGNIMSWQAAGGRADSVRRFRLGIWWNALLAAAWLALAAWRTGQRHDAAFAVVAGFGLFYAVLVGCILITSWKEAR